MSDLTREHDALVHPDGSECPDGCDAAPFDLSAKDRETLTRSAAAVLLAQRVHLATVARLASERHVLGCPLRVERLSGPSPAAWVAMPRRDSPCWCGVSEAGVATAYKAALPASEGCELVLPKPTRPAALCEACGERAVSAQGDWCAECVHESERDRFDAEQHEKKGGAR